MAGTPSFFQNAKDSRFKHCNFYGISGDYNLNVDRHNERGLSKLSKVISDGASHDSTERSPPPRCHPETRKEVLKLVLDWINDPSPSCSVLWVYGPAGAGKTAILQSIAELLNRDPPTEESDRKSGGSFFFSRGKLDRNQGHQLFCTIGYQLAMNLPSLRVHVDDIMLSNPKLHTKSMNVQFNSLIVEAFRRQKADLSHTPTVIIDGLDECEGDATQQNILVLISQAVIDKKIPLRFLIASRPEAHIRESFDKANLRTITHRVVLDDSFNPNKDIELFLRESFADICRNHSLMSQTPNTWPGDGIIGLLVQKASGQFIYATTVLKFVSCEFSSPIEQLDIVLAPYPLHLNEAFSDLDLLYTQILSSCRNTEAVVQVLGVILDNCHQPPEVIEDILDMEQGRVAVVLRGLHSLIHFPGTEGERYEPKQRWLRNTGADSLRLLHASFQDYLGDERRSGKFSVNIAESRANFVVAGFKLITRWIIPRGEILSRRPRLKTWGYLKWHLASHFAVCSESIRRAIIDDLEAFQQEFSMMTQDQDKATMKNVDIYPIVFDALHCAMTVLVGMMFGKYSCYERSLGPHPNTSLESIQDCTLVDFLDEHPGATEIVEYATIYYQYRFILDECYTSFSAYNGADLKTLTQLIDSVPGFLVQRTMLPVKAIADLSSVDLDLARNLLERNEQFVQRSSDGCLRLSRMCLNRHLSDFLRDESRSGSHHIRSSSHHAVICCYALSIFYDLDWSRISNLDEDVKTYLNVNFQQHLSTLDICVEELVKEHPTSRFLDQLDNIIYYSPDMRDAPLANLSYTWHATDHILRWLQRQQQLCCTDCDLQERLHRIEDRIYGQILSVEIRSVDEEIVGVITLYPPFLARLKDIVESGENTQSGPIASQDCDVDVVLPGRLEISDDFLLLPDYIISSLTEYLTNIKRAGRLYISPDKYHTQMAEYCLDMCPGPTWLSRGPPPSIMKMLTAERSWKFHLVRALPSKRIFSKLGVITFLNPSVESFRDIIRWLEGLPEPPLDVYIRWQTEILKKEEEAVINEVAPLRSVQVVRSDLLEEIPFKRKMDYIYKEWVVHGFIGRLSDFFLQLVVSM